MRTVLTNQSKVEVTLSEDVVRLLRIIKNSNDIPIMSAIRDLGMSESQVNEILNNLSNNTVTYTTFETVYLCRDYFYDSFSWSNVYGDAVDLNDFETGLETNDFEIVEIP